MSLSYRQATSQFRYPVMEVLFVLLVIIAALSAFDLLALRFGVDSRPGVGDDHVRFGTPRWNLR